MIILNYFRIGGVFIYYPSTRFPMESIEKIANIRHNITVRSRPIFKIIYQRIIELI